MMNPRKRPAPAPTHGAAPAQKRPAGGGAAAASEKQQLQPRVLYVLVFVARVYLCKRSKEEKMCNGPLRRLVREECDISRKKTVEEFRKLLDPISRSFEYFAKQTETHSERLDTLSHEMRQLKNLISNRDANECYRSEANQESAAIIEEVNQEETGVRFATSEAHKGQRVELRFLNKLNHLVYTKEKVNAEDGNPIKIAVFKNNQIVKSGPLSSARIQILALHGNFNDDVPENWTECQFHEYIVKSPKGHVLGGDRQVKLKNGETSLSDVSFNIPSGKTESGKLILAARVHCSDRTGLRIKEAVMNPVKVQVYRNKHNRISVHPKLKDEIHRLKGIAKNGCRDKWLKNNQIYTVEEFLKALNKNEEKIRTECFKLKKNSKDWKDTVRHARGRDLEGNCNLKSYRVEEQNVLLFFNCVHDLVGAKFCDHYVTKDDFNSDQQDAVNCLKNQAYDVLDDIAFDDKMKDNRPVSLSSAMNTSIIVGDASIPLTDTAGPNPPDIHVTTSQAVEASHHAEIYRAPELPQEFLDYNSGCQTNIEPSVEELIPPEEYLYDHQDECNQVGAMAQIFGGFSQAGGITAMGCYIGLTSEGTSSVGNNLIGLTSVPSNISDDIVTELTGI